MVATKGIAVIRQLDSPAPSWLKRAFVAATEGCFGVDQPPAGSDPLLTFHKGVVRLLVLCWCRNLKISSVVSAPMSIALKGAYVSPNRNGR